MSQDAPAEPQDAVIIKYTRERSSAFCRGVGDPAFPFWPLILLGVLSLFGLRNETIDFEVVRTEFCAGRRR